MTDAPRKPFWKRKRWIAAAVLSLLISAPMTAGLSAYLMGRYQNARWRIRFLHHATCA